MALKSLRFKIPPELAGQRLDDALIALVGAGAAPLSKGQARKLIVAGAVYLNRRRVRIASKPVIVGAELEAHVDFARIQTGASRSEAHRLGWKMGPDSILFEDEWLIAVQKPAGLPTQPTLDEARLNLYAALQKFLRERDSDPQAYVGLHHRLDRDTSGVVLFTKKKEANSGVSDLFAKHLAQKRYHALCTGPWIPGFRARDPGDVFTVRNFLKRLPGKTSRFGSVRSGGDAAHTDFEVASRLSAECWEFRCWPRTGRTHQIRVHLSELGLPIIGDPAYAERFERQIQGASGARVLQRLKPRLMLHAQSLEFAHPLTAQKMFIESPLPEDFLAVKKELLG
jgi:23S rRNA pseudouridine1911/1915/1917 synthase